MKSCLGMLLATVALIAVVGGAAFLWHLSESAEIRRSDSPEQPTTESR